MTTVKLFWSKQKSHKLSAYANNKKCALIKIILKACVQIYQHNKTARPHKTTRSNKICCHTEAHDDITVELILEYKILLARSHQKNFECMKITCFNSDRETLKNRFNLFLAERVAFGCLFRTVARLFFILWNVYLAGKYWTN